MTLSKSARNAIVKDIKTRAARLYLYREELVVPNNDVMRQTVVDNDLQVIQRMLHEISSHTGVDAAWLNAI